MYELRRVDGELLVVRPDGTILFRLDAKRRANKAHAEKIVKNLNDPDYEPGE